MDGQASSQDRRAPCSDDRSGRERRVWRVLCFLSAATSTEGPKLSPPARGGGSGG